MTTYPQVLLAFPVHTKLGLGSNDAIVDYIELLSVIRKGQVNLMNLLGFFYEINIIHTKNNKV